MTSLADGSWADLTFGIESLPSAAYVCAPDASIVSFNSAAQALWGRAPTPSDTCCLTIHWLTDDGSPAGHEACPVAWALAGRDAPITRHGVLGGPGHWVTLEFSSAPLFDEDGRLRGALTLMRPLPVPTAEVVERDARMQRALEAARLGSWVYDFPTGAFTASDQCKMNLGLPPGLDVRYEQDVVQRIDPDHQPAFRQLIADTVATGGSFQIEVPTRWPDGSGHWLLIAGRLIDSTCMVGVTLDISDRKDAQHRIADINRRKDEFIATLGHELRQPLAPMSLALTLLRADPPPDVSRQAQEILTRQLEHLTRLVDDLVECARVAQNKVTLVLEPIALQDVLSNVANIAAPEMSDKRLQFDIEMPADPIFVMGDTSRLQQIFSNLLLNAAKFTDSGGRVRVRLRQDGDRCHIEVRDSGRGVAPEVRTKLFDMFMQADTTTGLGIGLPVVKRLVELHDGTVEVTFTGPGAGTEFTVTLPVATVARQ